MQSASAPSNRSRYFFNGISVQPAARDRGRLSPHPPHLSRSPVVTASPRGTVSPFHAHEQPHPYFSRGPAAMGYVPQQAVRHYRHPDLLPVIPLREEFTTLSNLHDSSRSLALQELEQSRPHSVPSHYLHTSQTKFEHSARQIPRPTSVAHTSAKRLVDFNHPSLKSLSQGSAEEWGFSALKQGGPEGPAYEDDLMPPRRILPFLPSKQAHAQTTNSEAQIETMITKSPSLKVAVTTAQEADQCSTKKKTSSRKMAKASQSLPSNKQTHSEQKSIYKRSIDDAADNLHAPKRLKIRVINGYASQHEHNTSTHVNKGASQEFRLSQNSNESSQDDTISGDLDPVTGAVGASMTYLEPSGTRESSHPHPVEAERDVERNNALVALTSIPENLHSTMIDPSLSSHHDRGSKPDTSRQPSVKTVVMRDKPLRAHSPISKQTTARRSASQATTVSTASTTLLCTAGDEDVPIAKDSSNWTSMIDEAMILERDISDIVNTRLQQGNADLLDTLHGELLIKMALKNEKLFEAVSRILKS
ncbi:hypothetical protein E0Z10_g202 [Xylaria hypoxylon]|uniref:Uncharacterized protein n=1 Tax=Xylaria hypoxylon TaxID=37992 RepID=A0A4Z0ZHX7_9PEZI|nr:hypothetical protein E0Z10_g202 [Xylaria hypoxylon]